MRFDLKVILQHDRLTVEVESAVFRLLFKSLKHRIDHVDQHLPVALKRETPLAVPVGVGDEVEYGSL